MEAVQETMRHRSLAAEFSETNEVDRASGLGYIHVERYRMSAACSVASVCRFSGRGTEQKNSRTYSLFTVVGRLQMFWLCGMPRRVSCGSCLLCEPISHLAGGYYAGIYLLLPGPRPVGT